MNTGISLDPAVEQEIAEEMLELLAPQGLQLDWKSYYDRFDSAHGGYPIPFRGRLLWRDGWTYSSTDHAGPEWKPPEDTKELKVFKSHYWNSRRVLIADSVRRTEDDLRNLRETQRAKCVPLQVVKRVRSTNAEGIPIVIAQYEDIDFDVLEAKLKYDRIELEECAIALKELE